MKTTKLAWLISLALGTCTGTGAALAQPAPTGGSDLGSAAIGSAEAPVPATGGGSAEVAPTPVPVETQTPPGGSDTVHAGPTKPETPTTETPAHEGGAAIKQAEAEGGKAEPEGEANVDNSQYINWGSFSYGGKDYYGGKFGDGNMDFKDVHGEPKHETADEEKMSPPFILMLVNFALFLLILAKYMRPAGHKLAAERHDLIKNALEEAAKLRKQAEDKLAEYETKLGKADAEIKAMVDGMKADAEADKARMLAAADASAAQMKRDAELRIAAEIEYARAMLTREVTAAAAAATEKILRTQSTDADQQKLVGNFITDMASVQQKGARP